MLLIKGLFGEVGKSQGEPVDVICGTACRPGAYDRIAIMAECKLCNKSSGLISESLCLCVDCIRKGTSLSRSLSEAVHARVRQSFGLPASVPTSGKYTCTYCINSCSLVPGERGVCGVRRVEHGRITGGGKLADVSWYHDSLPTNCVGDWVCPGGTGAGYPRYSYSPGVERGYKNLAVFFHGCTFDCLFCQNWHHRECIGQRLRTIDELIAAVDARTACICYFGGDPTPHLPYAIMASRAAIRKNKGRILRICWETNGAMNRGLLKQMAQLSLQSGGCVKFDLKAYSEDLHLALCGVSNRRTLENFTFLAEFMRGRSDPPPIIASTLMVPGYVDEIEVSQIARFIASLDADIPYSLLAFHPDFLMSDLPPTSRAQAQACLKAARNAGLRRVRVGNIHLLW